MSVKVRFLGQSSLRFEAYGQVLYCDPYFSHQVEKLEGPDLKRQVPIPLRPEQIQDANWIFISHEHLDHCDIETLYPLMQASAHCRIVAPAAVVQKLKAADIDPKRLQVAQEIWQILNKEIRFFTLPAAHPQVARDSQGDLLACGYLFDFHGRRIYFAGDTSPDDALIKSLQALLPIHMAFLPVNERNYFKEKRGIIGNMSLREAFALAELIKTEKMVPIHWDMFLPNSVFKEEIELFYRLSRPTFHLEMDPQSC